MQKTRECLVTLIVACTLLWNVAEAVGQAAGPKHTGATLDALGGSLQQLVEGVSGSGFIIDADGHIITDAHVVEAARRVEVLLAVPPAGEARRRYILKPRGKLVSAQIVGVDRETDLAVLKIEETALPALELGDSDEIRQGQLVMALGSPPGFDNYVTMGVVSSVARQLRSEDPIIYIQTDALIHPGNSRGPLVDTEGHVVGINTPLMSQSGGSEGVGFAAPSNIVRHVCQQIRQHGHVHRDHIGVEAQTVTPVPAAGLGLARDWGVVLADVTPHGSADVAGLQVGDLILSLDDKVMESARQFNVNLYQRTVGSIITLEFLRGSEKLSRGVTVLEQPNDPDRLAGVVSRETNLVPKLGILAVTLDGRIHKMLPPLRKLSGVVVTSRVAGGASPGEHFHPGDVIYAVNREPVRNLESLQAALAELRTGDAVVVQVERHQRLMFIAFELQ